MMNSVRSNDLTFFTPLIEYNENKVCNHKFAPLCGIITFFTPLVVVLVIYYFVFA